MKKILLIGTLFALCFLCTNEALLAQSAPMDIHFGFQASPSFSSMSSSSNDIVGVGSNLGLKLGLIGENRFSDNYALSFGIGFHFNSGGSLNYKSRGKFWSNSDYILRDSIVSAGARLKYSLQYLEIPIGLRMRTQEFGRYRYYIEPALAIGIRTQARGTITTDKGDIESINITDEVNAFQLLWSVGGGTEYSIANNTALMLGIYYQSGFTGVAADNSNTTYPTTAAAGKIDDSKRTTGNLTIRIAVMF